MRGKHSPIYQDLQTNTDNDQFPNRQIKLFRYSVILRAVTFSDHFFTVSCEAFLSTNCILQSLFLETAA